MLLPLTVIGATTTVDLPHLQLPQLAAKVDTGAYYNALHCQHIELVQFDEQGNEYAIQNPAPPSADRYTTVLRFIPLLPHHAAYAGSWWYARQYRSTHIRYSNGNSEQRYIVRLLLVVAGQQLSSWFSLTLHRQPQFPVLLGRCVLRGRFVVDVSLD